MDMEEVFRKIVETLRREYDPDKIIVFGSHARGEATEDSDVDLFVVKRTNRRFVERVAEVSQLVHPYRHRPYRLGFDIIVETPDELARRLSSGDDFIQTVLREGRVLYDRSAHTDYSQQEVRHALAPCRHCHG